jgi:drug/metabolite transporter (DMT)-like permease
MSRQNLGLLIALTVLWGFNWPIMKVGLEDIPIWTFRGIASMSGGLGLLLIAKIGRQNLVVPRRERLGICIAAIFNLTIWNIAMLYGLSLMEAGRASIIAFTMPVWSSILSVIVLKERLKLAQIFGLALGVSGLLLLLAADIATIKAAPIGALFVLGAAIAWSIGTVAIKYFRFTMPTTVLAGWQQIIGGIPVAIVMLFYDIHTIEQIRFWPGFALFYNMTVTGILCYWIWFRIVTQVPVVMVTVSTLMIPVIGLFSGQVLLGEQPGWPEYAALVLIIGAIVAVMSPNFRARH